MLQYEQCWILFNQFCKFLLVIHTNLNWFVCIYLTVVQSGMLFGLLANIKYQHIKYKKNNNK